MVAVSHLHSKYSSTSDHKPHHWHGRSSCKRVPQVTKDIAARKESQERKVCNILQILVFLLVQGRFYPKGGQVRIALWSFIDTSNHLRKISKSLRGILNTTVEKNYLLEFLISANALVTQYYSFFFMFMDQFFKTHGNLPKMNYTFCKHNQQHSVLSWWAGLWYADIILIMAKRVYSGTTKGGHTFSLPIEWEHGYFKIKPSILLLSRHILLSHLCQCVLLHLICSLIFHKAASLILFP